MEEKKENLVPESVEEEELELYLEQFEEGEEIPPALVFSPRWYLNGFPKAGTHLLVSMMRPHATKMPPMQMHPKDWMGTFHFHSWSDLWADERKVYYAFGHLRPGYYYKGHCGYQPDLEKFLYQLGVAHVFIYRDLRDVVVSQAHHILSEKEEWKHQDKDAYIALGGFDEVLEACIVGLQTERCFYPGVVARWELYAPWLNVEWVHSIRYEDARQKPVEVATGIIEYGLWRLADTFGFKMIRPGDGLPLAAGEMAEASQDTDNSPTFRKGIVGGWKDVFTERHKELFKQTDESGWLVRLGYEESADW